MAFYEEKELSPSMLVTRDLGGLVTERATVAIDATNGILKRGTLLGKITKGAITGTKAPAGAGEEGANTGKGTLTMDTDTPFHADHMFGAYTIKVTRAYVADGDGTAGAYEVRNPAGSLIGTGTIGDTFDNQIKFVLAEDVTDKFTITDAFTYTIAQPAGSGQLAIVDKDATNGTDVPFGILVNDVDVSTAAADADLYVRGEFNQNEIIVPNGDSVANYKEALKAINIYLVDSESE